MKKPLFITLASIIVAGLFGAAVVGVDHHFYPGSNDSSSSTEGPGTGGGTDAPTENVVLPDVAACYGKRNVIHSVTFELTANDTMKAGYAAQVKKGDTTAYALVYTLHTAVVGCDSSISMSVLKMVRLLPSVSANFSMATISLILLSLTTRMSGLAIPLSRTWMSLLDLLEQQMI